MNKQTKTIVNFWCEGDMEENYLKGLLQEFQDRNVKFEYINLQGGNYKTIRIKLERTRYTPNIFIILDLDRANSTQEKKYLEELIKTARKSKGKIFLTYNNFEDWLRFHFRGRPLKEHFYRKFNVSSASEFKSQSENIYQKICRKGGDIAIAEEYFRRINPYCDKNFIIHSEQINIIHSSLFALRECLQELII